MQNKSGSDAVILNISSIAATGTYQNFPIYSGTKAAIAHLTRSYGSAYFYDNFKVKVIAVGPGLVRTENLERLFFSGSKAKYNEEPFVDAFLPQT